MFSKGEIDCRTHSPVQNIVFSQDTRHPEVCYPTTIRGGSLSSEIFVRRIENLNENYDLLLWTDKEGEIYHFHLSLKPRLDCPDGKILRDIPREINSRLRSILQSSVCHVNNDQISLATERGTLLFELGREKLTIHPRLPSRRNFDYQPYFVETLIGLGNATDTITRGTSGFSASLGVSFNSRYLDEITGDLSYRFKQNKLDSETLREIVNPYLRIETNT